MELRRTPENAKSELKFFEEENKEVEFSKIFTEKPCPLKRLQVTVATVVYRDYGGPGTEEMKKRLTR